MNLFHSVTSRQGTILYGVARLRCVVREGGIGQGRGRGVARVGAGYIQSRSGFKQGLAGISEQ